MTSRVEAVAEILWHRYSPDHEDSWPSPNADEYRRVASDILSALTTEPAAPEGQQEPVAYTGDPLDGTEDRVEAHLAARPSEQAVTEAAGPFITFANHAVEKTDDGWVWRTSSNERICDWFGPSDFAALKAAMEAGR